MARRLLDARQMVCLTGAPGIGKTELAVQLAVAFERDGYSIFWFDAEKPDLTEAWSGAAYEHLGLKGGRTSQQRAQQAMAALAGLAEPVLLVLDNVTTWKPFPLPASNRIRVLVTSRDRDLGGTELRVHEVGGLVRDEARNLVCDLAPSAAADDAGLNALLEHLDGYTLAVELAGVFLREFEEFTPTWYLSALRAGHQEHREGEIRDHARYRHTLAGALRLLWEQIGRERAPVRRYWQLAAQFEAAPATAALADAVGLDRSARAALRRFHLIRWDERRWSMHRLVREFGLEQTAERDRQSLRRSFFAGCVARATTIELADGFRVYVPDQPHFGAALALVPEFEAIPEMKATSLRAGVGIALHSLGDFEGAKRQHEQSLVANLYHGGEDDPRIAIDRSNLGLALKDLGETQQARDQLVRAVDAGMRTFGPNDPLVATMRSNLAEVLTLLNDFDSARRHVEIALESALRSLGKAHVEVALITLNLGAILHGLGEYKEAKRVVEQAIAAAVASRGSDHPITSKCKSSLAAILVDLGDFETAACLAQEALDVDLTAFGEDHPEVAGSRSTLALSLKHLGKLEEAEAQARKALDVGLRAFAPGHPTIADLNSNLAAVLLERGDHQAARLHMEQALEADRSKFGENDERVAIRYSNLAIVHRTNGNLATAIQFADRAVASIPQALSTPRATKAMAMVHLAHAEVLIQHGETERGEQALRTALDSALHVFGPDHFQVAHLRSRLAMLLAAVGDLEGARTMWEAEVESRIRRFEADDLRVANARSSLGQVLQWLGHFRDGRVQHQLAVESTLRKLTADDPMVLRYRGCVARCLQLEGHFVAAKATFEDILETERRRFGDGSPEVARARSDLATACGDVGDFARAKQLVEDALRVDEGHWGPDHLVVAIDRINLAEILARIGDSDAAKREIRETLRITALQRVPSRQLTEVVQLAGRLDKQLGPGETAILQCMSCDQKLSVPTRRGRLRVSCPSCRSSWIWSPDQGTT